MLLSSIPTIELRTAIVRDPLVVTPATTVMEAIAQMSGIRTSCASVQSTDSPIDDVYIEARSSCVLVVEGDRLVGILTERDVVRLSAQQHDLTTQTLREVMTYPIVTMRETEFTDLLFTVNLLQQHHIRHLPLLDDRDRLIGLLTHESLRQLARPVDLLRLRLAQEVMTTDVVTAAATTTMLAIAHLMASHRISSVVIVQPSPQSAPHDQPADEHTPRQIPIGIVTERDVVQFQALGLNLEACPVQTVMSTPIFSVSPEDSLWVVQGIMEQRRIRRLVVTNAQGALLGIVTQSSLLQALNPLELYRLAEILEHKVSQLEAEKVELLANRTVELERQVKERTIALQGKAEKERLIADLTNQIRSSLDLQHILDQAVQELRAFLNCDRVLVYRFQPDWSGLVVSESVGNGLSACMGDQIQDSCFRQQAKDMYSSGRTVAVDNIHTAGYRDCHVKLLERYQIKSNLVVPILVSGYLWGLLIGHQCDDYRHWQNDDLLLLDSIAVQLAIAVQQATAYQRVQNELTERKQTEILLRESEQRYVNLMAAAPVGIFRTDADGLCLYVNERWCAIAGLTPAEATGIGWMNALHPDDRAAIAEEWERSVHESRPFQLEYRFQRPDRTVTWVYGQSVADCDAEGAIKGYVGTVTDISDRKQVEIALQELNQSLERKVVERTTTLQQQEAQLRNLSSRLELAVKSAQIGIWDWDISNDHLVWDDRMCELYDISPTRFPSKAQIWVDSLHPDDVAHVNQILQQALAGEWVFDPEFRILLPNGTVRTLKAYALVQRNPQGEPLRMIGINYDISDRRLAEETLQKTNLELLRATRLKDEFLANMSHELRTPLNAILGMTEGLQEEVFGSINEAQKKALQTVERSSNHLLELINDILDLAKIEAGQVELHSAPTSIAPLCRSSLAFVKQQALKKQIRLNLLVPPYLPELFIDERRIRQVLINLLNNAVKFTLEGGNITLEVTLDSVPSTVGDSAAAAYAANSNPVNQIHFAVIDTGIGIAPDDLKRLFQPFIQVDSSLNRQYQGTGLGLSLVKRIIEMHSGTVNVSSQVGVGSRFSFTLPCPEFASPPALSTQPASAKLMDTSDGASINSQLILLAEDNEANILTVSGYLRAKGYRLIVANNGQEAIALAHSQRPSLILMDIQMPGMDGLEAMRQIRQDPEISAIPMIALTALAMSGDRDRCLAAGANDYITKPIKLKQLAVTIQQFLSS